MGRKFGNYYSSKRLKYLSRSARTTDSNGLMLVFKHECIKIVAFSIDDALFLSEITFSAEIDDESL